MHRHPTTTDEAALMGKLHKISTRNFPTATDILVRLPPNVRRRLCLVSRLWRAVIDRRTAMDMRPRGKILAVTTEGISYVLDVLSPGTPPRYLPWSLDSGETRRYNAMSIIGTCNGIVCLCDNWKPGGALTLANPSTGETLDLPPLPPDSDDAIELLQGRCRGGGWNWHQTYSFAYHPVTRRYNVVHVPSHFDPSVWEPSTVHVFTLGEASWRDVHVGSNARCVLGPCRLADVDGTVYWMSGYTGRVMALNLEDESVTHTRPLPPATGPGESWLTKVHGRLGVVVGGGDSVTVWVLEDEGWSRRYVVEARLWQTEQRLRWEVTMPHFAHGDYVLTHGGSGKSIDGSKMSQARGGMVQIRCNEPPESVLCHRYHIHRTFAYVETNEPLSIYSGATIN
ncbi:unnamed protein product [Alopecurus aequalis]